jgi:hypothetical protein
MPEFETLDQEAEYKAAIVRSAEYNQGVIDRDLGNGDAEEWAKVKAEYRQMFQDYVEAAKLRAAQNDQEPGE